MRMAWMNQRQGLLGWLALASALAFGPVGAQGAAGAEEPAPTFDAAFLGSAASITAGKEVWDAQCRHCHGNSAYPGKAPKLRPGAYTPDFVYDRVTYGFRSMPAWKDVFTLEQRKAVVAYVKSTGFSP